MYERLLNHVGHNVEVVTYGAVGPDGPENVAVECHDCCEILVDCDAPEGGQA